MRRFDGPRARYWRGPRAGACLRCEPLRLEDSVRLATHGSPAGHPAQRAVRYFIVYELSAAARERGVSDLTRWMEEGRVKHAIATKMPLERTTEAHELLEQGKVIGNIVLEP